jgi:nitronate monooxygenase
MLAARPHVFSFAFGAPSPEILRECRTRAIVTIGTATTVDEARALEAADVDAIVAMGLEAGGHAGSFLHASEKMLIGSLALLPQVVDAVKLPVIAAGGIADARGIVAALALGAQAVQIGTAFLACEQSGAPLEHRDKLFSDAAKETALSRVFSGRLARGIRNRLMDEMTARVTDPPPYPVQSWFTNTFRKAAIGGGADCPSHSPPRCCRVDGRAGARDATHPGAAFPLGPKKGYGCGGLANFELLRTMSWLVALP